MSKIETLVPLLSALRDLVAWLKAKRVKGLIIGDVAASILGRPRVTRYVDALVLIDEKDWDGFLTAIDAHKKLNLRRIRRWVREFSTVVEMPEIFNDLEKILVRGPKRKR